MVVSAESSIKKFIIFFYCMELFEISFAICVKFMSYPDSGLVRTYKIFNFIYDCFPRNQEHSFGAVRQNESVILNLVYVG